MMARGGLAILVCLLATLTLPAGAAAKPGYYVEKPGRAVVLQREASHGYHVFLFGVNRRSLTLSVSGEEGSANYVVRGRVGGEKIEGRFGNLGRVAMRFVPEGAPRRGELPANCEGKPPVEREGHFVGQLRFKGEHGFTRVRAARAEGVVVGLPRRVCKGHRPEIQQPLPSGRLTSLSAIPNRPGIPRFSVYKQEPSGPEQRPRVAEEAVHIAFLGEKRSGMAITRQASAFTTPETFAVSPLGQQPDTATVSPPAPFSGTATFEEQADGTARWSGDLKVELPGRGAIPLTGPDYRARLCRSFACFCPGDACGGTIIISGRPQLMRLARFAARVLP
jgi:hypothetical protein